MISSACLGSLRTAAASAILTALVSLQGCDVGPGLTAEEHIERAKDMAASGDLRGMVIQLKNAIQKSPDNPQARLMLGEAYLEFKQADNALKELSHAQKLGVAEARIKPLVGEALIQNHEYQRVLDEIQTSASDSPRNRARITQLRADALLGLRKFAEGCALFEESTRIDPLWHKALVGTASCEYGRRHVDAARQALVKASQIAPRSTESWVSLAKLERNENRPQAARKALDNALKANASDLDALSERATLLVSMRDFKAARRDAEQIQKLYRGHFQGDYLLALIAFNEKNADLARDHVARALQAAPGHLPSLLLSGALEYAQGNMQTAETQLARVLQNWPRQAYASRLLAAAQLAQGRADEAAQTLEKIDPSTSSDVAVRLLAGEIALSRKQYDAANDHLEKAAALEPANALIRTQLAKVRLALGDQRGLADLGAASAMDSSWQGADRTLILDHIRNARYDAALQSIAVLEKKAPASPQPWNLRGLVYLSQKNLPKARESFERALKLDPAHLPATANLAQLDLYDNKPDAARARFESVLKIDKTNLDALLGLAGLADRAGNRKEQLARLEQAQRSAPRALQPLLLLNRFYLAEGDHAKALVFARQANDAHPDDVAALAALGNTQYVSGDLEASLSTHKKAVELAPRSAEARLALARSQRASKQTKDARTTLLRARELEPENVRVLDALMQVELSDRHFDRALQIAQEIQTRAPKSPLGFEREGDVRVAQGQAKQAVESYAQALRLTESSVGTLKLLRALHFSGDTARTDAKLAEWLKIHPQDRLVRGYAAEYYLVTGRSRSAIAQYEYLIRLQPDQAAYLNNLANLYQREKDQRAQATAERALKLAPDEPGIQDTLGWILVEKGEVAAGLGLLKKAAARAPRAATVRYHFAVALAKSGNRPQAKKELQSLLAGDSDFAEADAARKLLATL